MDGRRSAAFVLQIRLMAGEAATRLDDAEILSSTLATQSNSSYLLSLLAFELLLKAVLRLNGQSPGRNHSYSKLFRTLSSEVQKRLLEAASKRMNDGADFSRLDSLLDAWSRNFVDLRYPYEKYEGLAEDEYRARGEAWLAKGANEGDADFVYRPEELYGLTHALQTDVETWLRNRSQDV